MLEVPSEATCLTPSALPTLLGLCCCPCSQPPVPHPCSLACATKTLGSPSEGIFASQCREVLGHQSVPWAASHRDRAPHGPPAAPRALTHQAMLGPWGSALSFSFPGVREASAVLHMTGGRKRAGTSKCGATVALDLPADSARPLSLLQKPSAASAQGSPPGGHSSVKRLPHL